MGIRGQAGSVNGPRVGPSGSRTSLLTTALTCLSCSLAAFMTLGKSLHALLSSPEKGGIIDSTYIRAPVKDLEQCLEHVNCSVIIIIILSSSIKAKPIQGILIFR